MWLCCKKTFPHIKRDEENNLWEMNVLCSVGIETP